MWGVSSVSESLLASEGLWSMELVMYLVFFTNDVPLWYTNSKNEVQTINHNYICISLLQ